MLPCSALLYNYVYIEKNKNIKTLQNDICIIELLFGIYFCVFSYRTQKVEDIRKNVRDAILVCQIVIYFQQIVWNMNWIFLQHEEYKEPISSRMYIYTVTLNIEQLSNWGFVLSGRY